MGKLLLNLTPGEPLALMKKLPCFDDPIELDVLLVGALHLEVHDPINCRMFNAFEIEFCRGQVLDHVQSVQERWKLWSKQFHIKHRVQAKERRNNYFKIIITHSLGYGVIIVSEWA
jgi:hypothetical protein